MLVTVPHIAMANLLAGRSVVPELIQHHATPASVAREAAAILDDPAKAVSVRNALLEVRRSLGEPGAIDRAAAAVLAGTG